MHYLKPLEIDFTFNKAIIFNKDIKFIKEPFKVDFTVRKAVNLKQGVFIADFITNKGIKLKEVAYYEFVMAIKEITRDVAVINKQDNFNCLLVDLQRLIILLEEFTAEHAVLEIQCFFKIFNPF